MQHLGDGRESEAPGGIWVQNFRNVKELGSFDEIPGNLGALGIWGLGGKV